RSTRLRGAPAAAAVERRAGLRWAAVSPAPASPDGRPRCSWPLGDPLYLAYHDTEWGVPEWDDRALFEKLLLDGFQAGLAWIIILRKREHFRRAFDGFEPARIARWRAARGGRLARGRPLGRDRGQRGGRRPTAPQVSAAP